MAKSNLATSNVTVPSALYLLVALIPCWVPVVAFQTSPMKGGDAVRAITA